MSLNSESFQDRIVYSFDLVVSSLLIEIKDRSLLYRVLSTLQNGRRHGYEDDKVRQMYDKGCLTKIISNLNIHTSREKLNLNLTIIALCCTREICFEQAITKYNLLNQLSSVLHKYKHDHDIQRRVFRIINKPFLIKLYYFHVNEGLLNQIVTEETQRTLISSALEYLRMTALSSIEIKSCESSIIIFETMGMLLVQFERLSQSTVGYERVIKAILTLTLRLICCLKEKDDKNEADTDSENCESNGAMKTSIIKEEMKLKVLLLLKNTEVGNALALLGKLSTAYPEVVVKIVVNLSEFNSQTTELPVGDIINNLIELPQDQIISGNGEMSAMNIIKKRLYNKHRTELLCLLLQHPDIYIEGHLIDKAASKLIQILQSITKPCESELKSTICIISTLTAKCSPTYLSDHGCIEVVSSKLDWMSHSKLSTNHTKRTRNYSYSKLHKRVKLSPTSSAVQLSRSYEDSSDDESDYCCYGGAFSHNCNSETSYDLSDMLNTEKSEFYYSQSKEEFINTIIIFVKHLAHTHAGGIKIISSELLTKLLRFFIPNKKSLCTPQLIKVVLLIVQNPNYRFEILQSDFIIEASKFQKRSHGPECSSCNTLAYVGKYLLNNFKTYIEQHEDWLQDLIDNCSLPVKQKLLSVIPYLIEPHYSFYHSMLTCRGLNVMIEALGTNLHSNNVEIGQRCMNGLCTAAQKLRIESPRFLSYSPNLYHHKFPPCLQSELESTVCFILDDDTRLTANRELLGEKSVYFQQLLCGKFMESHQTEVHIRNTNTEAFKYLLKFLHCEISIDKICCLDVPLSILLDVLSLAHRYLLEDLISYLNGCILHFQLNPDTASTIYQWSLQSKTNILRHDVVAYTVTTVVNELRRSEMFKNLSQLECWDIFSDDMQKLFVKYII